MIYLLWCTVRPEMFISTHKYWMDMCSNNEQIITKVAVNTQQQEEAIKAYASNIEVIVVGDDVQGASYPTYCLTSKLTCQREDVVVLSSDDMYPPHNWDEYITNKLNGFEGCLFVRDGYQELDTFDGIPSIVLPIMTFGCLQKLNKIICHPEYYHLFADTELYFNVRALGLLKDERETDITTFEHRHYVFNKREADEQDKKYQITRNHDAQTFYRRMKLPIEERLRVNIKI